MKPDVGMQVTPSLQLVRELGRGGMGSVWVAEHSGLQAEVAVKFVKKSVADENPGMHERFRREASVAAKLKSPHVVTVFDHGVTEDGTPYIAMELLEGESLGARIQRVGTLTPEEVALVVTQTCQVLDEAHRKGIVHRDIKPANLFLVDAGYELFVKVLDFGIAKTESEQQVSVTSTGDILGSPLYMSPEQFTDPRDTDPRWDLWSLSVVAYKALTSLACFQGDSVGKVMMAVMTREFDPPTVAQEDLPPALDAFFERAFADEIDDRFATAPELAEAFVAAVGASDLHPTSAHISAPRMSRPGISRPDASSMRHPSAADGSEAPTVTGGSQPGAAESAVDAGTFSPSTTGSVRPRGGSMRWIGVAALLLGGGVAATVFGTGDEPAAATAAAPAPPTASSSPAATAAGPAAASAPAAATSSAAPLASTSASATAEAPTPARVARPPVRRRTPPPPSPPPAPSPPKDEGRAGRVLF